MKRSEESHFSGGELADDSRWMINRATDKLVESHTPRDGLVVGAQIDRGFSRSMAAFE
jgi:hypothetical protein